MLWRRKNNHSKTGKSFCFVFIGATAAQSRDLTQLTFGVTFPRKERNWEANSPKTE